MHMEPSRKKPINSKGMYHTVRDKPTRSSRLEDAYLKHIKWNGEGEHSFLYCLLIQIDKACPAWSFFLPVEPCWCIGKVIVAV